jgi:hypothetical protein
MSLGSFTAAAQWKDPEQSVVESHAEFRGQRWLESLEPHAENKR